MICNKCGTSIPDDSNAEFCYKCGIKLVNSDALFCHKCGTKALNGAAFCLKCGVKLVNSSSEQVVNEIQKTDSHKTEESVNTTNKELSIPNSFEEIKEIAKEQEISKTLEWNKIQSFYLNAIKNHQLSSKFEDIKKILQHLTQIHDRFKDDSQFDRIYAFFKNKQDEEDNKFSLFEKTVSKSLNNEQDRNNQNNTNSGKQLSSNREDDYTIQSLKDKYPKFDKAMKKYTAGKEYDEECLPVFLDVFDKHPIIELARNICDIYKRSEDPLRVISFIDKEKVGKLLNKKERRIIGYQACKKAKKYEEAYEFADILLNSCDNETDRQLYTKGAIECLFYSGDYKKALDYCWKEVANITLRLKYEPYCKAILKFAATCIIHIQRDDRKYKPDAKLLELVKKDTDANFILEYPEDALMDELTVLLFNINLDEFTKDILSELNLLKARKAKMMQPVIDDTGRFKGDGKRSIVDAAKNMAFELTKNCINESANDRYDSYIYAARVIYDALDHISSNGDTNEELTRLLYTYLRKAFLEKANYLLFASSTATTDEARYLYMECVKYTQSNSNNKQKTIQERIDAVTRSILSVFVKREKIPAATMGNGINLSINMIERFLTDYDYTSGFNVHLFLGVIVRNLICIPKALRASMPRRLGALLKHPSCVDLVRDDMLNTLNLTEHSTGIEIENDDEHIIDVEKMFEMFEEKYIELEDKFRKYFYTLRKNINFRHEWINDVRNKMSSNDFILLCRYIENKDKENFAINLMKIIDIIGAYINETSFFGKEKCLKDASDLIVERLNSIVVEPTQYSYEFVKPVLEAWNKFVLEELNTLYLKNPPNLKCEIVGSGDGWISMDDDGVGEFQLKITNEGDNQIADNVQISVIDKKDIFTVSNVKRAESRRIICGEPIYCDVVITMKTAVRNEKPFDVCVHIDYTCTDGEDEIKKSYEVELTAYCGNKRDVELVNPYSRYSASGTVYERSMVFGRDKKITEIIDVLQGDGTVPLRSKAIMLYGQKRSGKSTILYHIAYEIRERMKNSIIIDIGDLSDIAEENNAFEMHFYKSFFDMLTDEIRDNHSSLWDALKKENVEIPHESEITDVASGKYCMRKFFTKFNRFIDNNEQYSNKNIIMIIDEFTKIYGFIKKGIVSETFMDSWKAMLSNYRLVAVVAAQDYVQDFIDAYANQFGTTQLEHIDYLDKDAVRDMVLKPFKEIADWDVFSGETGEEAISHIRELTAGNAFLTMIFLDRLVTYLNKKSIQFVTSTTVYTVLHEEILRGSNPLDLNRFESLYNDDGNVDDSLRPSHNLAILWTIATLHKEGLKYCSKNDIQMSDRLKMSSELDEKRIGFLIDKLAMRKVLDTKKSIDKTASYRIYVGMFSEYLSSICSVDSINAYHIQETNRHSKGEIL